MVARMMIVALLGLVSSSLAFAPIQEASFPVSASCPNDLTETDVEKALSKSAVITMEAFFDRETCQTYRESSASHVMGGGNNAGEVIVESNHVQKLLTTFRAMGSATKVKEGDDVIARHTYLETSSWRHRDHFVEGDTQGQLVTSRNAFVFLNSNSDAFFLHGESDKVPVVEGTLVVFDGSVPHHTEVSSGVVHLLGPLNTESLVRVGNSTETEDPPVVDCEDGFLLGTTCFEFGILQLFLTVSGIIGGLVLCTVGLTPTDS